MDEQEIGVHQFLGYIVNHVPEYRDDYRALVSRSEAGPPEMLEGFARFIVDAWKDRDHESSSAHPSDTFSRLAEAVEMGLRSQGDSLAVLVVDHLRNQMAEDHVTREMQAQLGVYTQELLFGNT